ncbi:MAG: TPM domain-containing protein [Gammaproteobacteria bacterium]
MLQRWFRHLTTTQFKLRRCFPTNVLNAIDAAITASEQAHQAEIRFAVETALPLFHLWRGVSGKERAREIFSRLGMADTAAHNGILVYVLLAERDIEIVADQGFADKVGEEVWRDICSRMTAAFRNGDYGQGSLQAIGRLGELAIAHFPPGTDNRNELPNRPVLL